MKYFIFSSLLFVVASCHSVDISISTTVAKSWKSVEGIVDCGSTGTVHEVRVTDCDAIPCQLFPDEMYDLEVDFSTSLNGSYWRVQVDVYVSGQTLTLVDEDIIADIFPEEYHTLHYVFPVTDMYAGLPILVRMRLTEKPVNRQEVCISAIATVANAPIPTTTSSY